jgi:hypothetical protein
LRVSKKNNDFFKNLKLFVFLEILAEIGVFGHLSHSASFFGLFFFSPLNFDLKHLHRQKLKIYKLENQKLFRNERREMAESHKAEKSKSRFFMTENHMVENIIRQNFRRPKNEQTVS